MNALVAHNGISSLLHITTDHNMTVVMKVRHFQWGSFILERGAHTFMHNEAVTLNYHYIVDKTIYFVRLPGRVKFDRHSGLRIEFERDSMLYEASRRLHNAKYYTRPCDHIFRQHRDSSLALAI